MHFPTAPPPPSLHQIKFLKNPTYLKKSHVKFDSPLYLSFSPLSFACPLYLHFPNLHPNNQQDPLCIVLGTCCFNEKHVALFIVYVFVCLYDDDGELYVVASFNNDAVNKPWCVTG